MADRYATNAFTGFNEYEAGVFDAPITADQVMGSDNPAFLYPSKTLRNAATGTTQKVQRGYMRMISSGMPGAAELSKRRLHFQFNPDSIVRSVTARNDVQFWMNQEPSQLMQPIPGDSNFAFELLFNREAEVVTGTYNDGGVIRESRSKAVLPLNGAGNTSTNSVTIPHSAVTDIGVLADLQVFDEIIGQGINTQLIKAVLDNAEARATLNQTRNGSTSTNPTTTAVLTAKVEGGVVTEVKIDTAGSGYVSSPTATFSGGGGTGLAIEVDVSDGRVTNVNIVSGGSGYTSAPTITLTGGGNGTTTSSSGTSDEQDSESSSTPFDRAEAERGLYNNFGNSAFLVATPVRIVFSSLFMVEGYITSTMVTFNKFNANMVPTQCAVGISMQALYIGFARKDTFLTLTLDDLQEEYENADTATEQRERADLQKGTALGRNLFTKVFDDTISDNKSKPTPKNILGDADNTHTLIMRLRLSDDFDNERKRVNVIKQLDYEFSWDVIYLGNTDYPGTTPIPPGVSTYKRGERLWNGLPNPLLKTGTIAVKDLKRKTEFSQQFKIEPENAVTTSQIIDTSNKSRYSVLVECKFYLQLVTGQTIECQQKYSLRKVVSWNGDIDLKEGRLLLPVADARDFPAAP